MNFRRLFLLCINICCVYISLAGTGSFRDTNRTIKQRVLLVGVGFGIGLAGSYWYVQNNWWEAQQVKFHFDNGSDLRYALNVDKAGHFIGGIQSSDVFGMSMRWAGIEEKKSVWYGALFGTSLQLAIEMKDGYSPYWGFSKWDLGVGALGSLWPVAKYYYKDLQAINFKFSYYQHTESYVLLEEQRGNPVSNSFWQDDYPNQTYWITFDINTLFKNFSWPDWLNLAVGFGIDETQYINEIGQKHGGNNEWYIAFDYDLPKMFKKWDTPAAKKIKYWLNYFHLPAPTIRILPSIKYYPLFL